MQPETRQLLRLTDNIANKLEKLHLHSAWDLALHLPLRYEDETQIIPIAAAPIGEICQVEGVVLHQEIQFKPRKQLIARIKDDSEACLNLRFIHFYPNHQKQLAQGATVRALGEIKRGFYGDEMIHPKLKSPENNKLAQSLTPIYPTTNGLNQPTLRKAVQAALDVVDLTEVLPEKLLKSLKLPSLAESLRTLHNPPPELSMQTLADGAFPAWQRLKFDELLAQQLSMRLARQRRKSGNAKPLIGNGVLSKKIVGKFTISFDSCTAARLR